MRKLSPLVLGLSIAVAGSVLAAAQDTSSDVKIMQVTREYTKPGRNGMIHDKAESAFVQAMTKAKFPAYYVGLTSMTGKSRSLFLFNLWLVRRMGKGQQAGRQKSCSWSGT